MKPGRGGTKGSEFEREICKKLSLWWTQDNSEGPKDNIFWRTAGSGARATQRNKKGLDSNMFSGDIGLLDSKGEDFLKCCVIEIKRGYSLQFDLLNYLDGTKSEGILFKFWDKIYNDGDKLNKEPLLIFRRDRKNVCIVLKPSLISKIMYDSGPFLGKKIIIGHDFIHSLEESKKTIILLFSEFLDWAKPISFSGDRGFRLSGSFTNR